MSLEQANVLDYISANKKLGHVALSISDDLDWEEPQKHLLLLQDKLNFYLGFIESNQIYTDYPDAKGREIDIRIYAQYTIPEIGIEFLSKVADLFRQAGYNLKTTHNISSINNCFPWF